MKRQRGSKYNFPTRILSRAQKFIQVLLTNRGVEKTDERYSELFWCAFNLSQELLLLRLLELNWILESGWLSQQIKSSPLNSFFERLKEINERLGVELFKPGLSEMLELKSEELLGFVEELYLPKFLPALSPPELLGALMEKLGLFHPEQAPFFTPGPLVKLMVEESFKLLGWDQGPLEGKDFMILDPSFGAGNFLLGLLRTLIKVEEDYYAHRPSGLFYPLVRLPDLSRTIEVELRIELVKKHLFGLELSSEGRLSAFRALALVMLSGKKIEELNPGQLKFLEMNFPLGDFLIDQRVRTQVSLFERNSLAELMPFSFQDENYPHQKAMSRGGFDLIIGNPPWISLKGRQRAQPYNLDLVEWLIERYQADSYRPNLFEMFIRRAIELLKEEGINCFLVPDRLAENLQFQGLREFMVEAGQILRLHFREPFPGIISDTLIYWLRKRPSDRKTAVGKILVTQAQMGRRQEAEVSLRRFIRKGGGIAKEVSEEALALLEKIRKEARGKISDYLTSGVGLIARQGTIHPEKTHPNQQEVIKGENVQEWKISGHYYFEYHPRNLIGGTTRYSKLTARERILVRKTGSQLMAGLDRSGALVEQSAYFLIPKPGKKMKYAMEYFLALLNSALLNFYYQLYLVTNPESTPQLKKFHLDQLPVKRLNLKDFQEKEIYERILELARKILEESDPAEEKKLKQKLNHLIFDLHHLNAQERALILGKE